MIFSVHSDLFEAGRNEDGEAVFGEVFFVLAEDAKGNRWAHYARFPNRERKINDEGCPYFVVVPGAKDRAENLLARINASGGRVDLERNWVETYPAYGSEAYQEQEALGFHTEWERECEFA